MAKRLPRRWVCLWGSLFLLFALAGSLPAQEPPSWVPLWVDRSATVSSQALQTTLDQLALEQRRPDLLVVMLHGYDMGQEESSRMYDGLAAKMAESLATPNVTFVGLQWEAGGGNFFSPASDYFSTLTRARAIGRGPLRQLLLAVEQRNPGLPVAAMAHSMGCEVILAAIVPELAYREQAPESGTFEAERELALVMAAFTGSDLDYDVWYQAGEAAQLWFDRCRLTWSTVSDPSSPGDRVLSLRARLRGKALGSTFPRLTLGQLDRIVPSRRLYLDGESVPGDHAFDAYFDSARTRRIVAALNSLIVPSTAEPPELTSLQAVLRTPDELRLLLPHLDSPYTGAAFAALWRVERLNCGDARHMADQTLERALLMLARTPQAVWREQFHSDCVTMRKAQFPTAKMMTKAGAPPWARPARYQPQH